ncbi:hypothetical protein ACWGNH_30865 [Streptomyces albidoflavus]
MSTEPGAFLMASVIRSSGRRRNPLAEGCVMSWSGVREFAAEIGQCFDLLVVDDLGDRLVTLSAVDSGSWGS